MVHVLVVEDDVKLNQIVCSSLSAAGYTAHGCLNAQGADGQPLGVLQKDRFDIPHQFRECRSQMYGDSAQKSQGQGGAEESAQKRNFQQSGQLRK